MNRLVSFVIAALIAVTAFAAGQPGRTHAGSLTIFVKLDATGDNNGTSWDDAYSSLAVALNAAASGDVIYVATVPGFSYRPTTDANRAATFTLKDNVAIFGGFTGTEDFPGQRSSETPLTVLSGNVGSAFSATDNSYHVVTVPAGITATLDGFKIQDGRATGAAAADKSGAGIWIQGNAPDLTFGNLWIKGNVASQKGGGLYAQGTIGFGEDLEVEDNDATTGMGFMLENPNATFLNRVTFASNTGGAGTTGGGLAVSGAGNVQIRNATFTGNAAATGAAVDVSGTAVTSLTGVTVYNNTSTAGGAVATHGGSPDVLLATAIVSGNTPAQVSADASGVVDVNGAIIDGGCPANANCITTPLTSDPQLGPRASNGGRITTHAIPAESPAVDAGVSSPCPVDDARGIQRPIDGVTGQVGGDCDFGAFEFVPPPTIGFESVSANLNEDAGDALLTVTLDHTFPEEVAVQYAVTGGSASATDFDLPPGLVRLRPGEPSTTLTVPITDDTVDEPGETLEITLSSPTNATLGSAVATVTIGDNDAAPSVAFSAASSSVGEGGGTAKLTVALSGPSGKTVKVDYRAIGGTATSGDDYTLPPGTLTFTPGVTSRQVTVAIVNDKRPEAAETMGVAIEDPSNATLGTLKSHTLTINDNEAHPKCQGKAVTIYGTPGVDTITGTAGVDVIHSLGGNDVVNGAGGNDVICAGPGNDRVKGGPGADELIGSGGNDSLAGGGGNDLLKGGGGNDALKGEGGSDRFNGGRGDKDTCNGGSGKDTLLPKHGCETVKGIP